MCLVVEEIAFCELEEAINQSVEVIFELQQIRGVDFIDEVLQSLTRFQAFVEAARRKGSRKSLEDSLDIDSDDERMNSDHSFPPVFGERSELGVGNGELAEIERSHEGVYVGSHLVLELFFR